MYLNYSSKIFKNDLMNNDNVNFRVKCTVKEKKTVFLGLAFLEILVFLLKLPNFISLKI